MGGFDFKLMMSLFGFEVKVLVDGGGKLVYWLFSFLMFVILVCNGYGVVMGLFILLFSDVWIGMVGVFKIGVNEI